MDFIEKVIQKNLKTILKTNNIKTNEFHNIVFINQDLKTTWIIDPIHNKEERNNIENHLIERINNIKHYLRKDVDNDYEEGIEIFLSPTSGTFYRVKNLLGDNEQITVLDDFKEWEAWFESRQKDGDTLWDNFHEIRLYKPMVFNDGRAEDFKTLIDDGCVAFILLLEELGIKTHFSCAGHPKNPYIVFENDFKNKNISKVSEILLKNHWYDDSGRRKNELIFRTENKNNEERKNKWRNLIEQLSELKPGYLENLLKTLKPDINLNQKNVRSI
jgi:hypothetical protein